MGLGKALVRSAGAPNANPGMFYGHFNDAAGPWALSHPYHGALAVPAVHRAATLISDLIGALPWQAFRDRAGKTEKLDGVSLLDQPAPPDTRVNSISSWVLDLLLEGNAFGIIAERDSQGVPTAITPVPARFVGVQFNGDQVRYYVGARDYGVNDVFHVKGWCPPGWLRGFGVLEHHFDFRHGHHGAISLAQELQRQAKNVSQAGVPTGIINVTNPDATTEQLQGVKAGWLDSQRDRTVAVLNATTTFQPLSWNPTETQLLDARKFSLLEIANIFGIPPKFVGAESGGSMQYSTSETESIDLLKFSLGGHLARFEQAFSALLPRGTCVKANLDALLRSDTTARYTAHSVGIGAGFLLRSEARAMEDLPEVKGIDDEPLPKKAEVAVSKTDPVSPTVAQVPAPGSNDSGGANG